MFGTPFGLGLDDKEVDTFLIKKIHKKLKFWNMVHLPIMGQVVIVKFVLASTLWFFINIWGGTKKAIRKCQFLFQKNLWARSDQRAKARVKWFDCCASKDIKGLGFIDSEEVIDTLLCK
jgi:hypothetical protein